MLLQRGQGHCKHVRASTRANCNGGPLQLLHGHLASLSGRQCRAAGAGHARADRAPPQCRACESPR
eukprot:6934826-Alexandrium_andersonii.AAC.1